MADTESSFTVLTGNKFGFLLDDVEDPDEILNAVKEEKPKQKSKKAKPEKNAQKPEDAKQAGRIDSAQNVSDSGAKKPRRERVGQQQQDEMSQREQDKLAEAHKKIADKLKIQ